MQKNPSNLLENPSQKKWKTLKVKTVKKHNKCCCPETGLENPSFRAALPWKLENLGWKRRKKRECCLKKGINLQKISLTPLEKPKTAKEKGVGEKSPRNLLLSWKNHENCSFRPEKTLETTLDKELSVTLALVPCWSCRSMVTNFNKP